MQTQAFVAAVDQAMEEAVAAYTETFAGSVLAETAVAAHGKRVRSRLIGLCADDLGVEPQQVVSLAAAAEMVHAGSLQHDDVLDDADTRRGVPATHVRYGNHVAILGGDMLLALAVGQVAGGPRVWTVESARTLAKMSGAASDEIYWRERREVCPVSVWEGIARGKTGALFRFCLGGTGVLIDEQRYRTLSQFGEELGVLYQWVDDLLDFVPRTGKRRFADLFEHNPNRVLSAASAAGMSLALPVVDEAAARALATALQPHWERSRDQALAAGGGLSAAMVDAGLPRCAHILDELLAKLAPVAVSEAA